MAIERSAKANLEKRVYLDRTFPNVNSWDASGGIQASKLVFSGAALNYRGAQLSGDGRGGQGLWVQRFLGFFDAAVDGGLPIGMRDD